MVYATYRARKPMDIGDTKRQPLELVPEAQTWFRVQHLVHAGYLVPEVVEDNDFETAVRQFCPELSDQLIRSEMEKKMTQDKAAQDALEANRRMVENPREELANRHAAPEGNPNDPSNSDVDAKAALQAAVLTEGWEKENAERDARVAKATLESKDDQERGVEPDDEIDLDGAHKGFVSDMLDLDDDAKDDKAEQAKSSETKAREAGEKAQSDGDSEEGKANQTDADKRAALRDQTDRSEPAKAAAAKKTAPASKH